MLLLLSDTIRSRREKGRNNGDLCGGGDIEKTDAFSEREKLYCSGQQQNKAFRTSSISSAISLFLSG